MQSNASLVATTILAKLATAAEAAAGSDAATAAGTALSPCDGIMVISAFDGLVAHVIDETGTAFTNPNALARQFFGIVSDSKRVVEAPGVEEGLAGKLSRVTVAIKDKEYIVTTDQQYIYVMKRDRQR